MKKLIIGLLIVAAGAGTYMYFQNKKTSEKPGADHALIIGYWKADTLHSAKDNAFRTHSFQFADSSTLILTGNDSRPKKIRCNTAGTRMTSSAGNTRTTACP